MKTSNFYEVLQDICSNCSTFPCICDAFDNKPYSSYRETKLVKSDSIAKLSRKEEDRFSINDTDKTTQPCQPKSTNQTDKHDTMYTPRESDTLITLPSSDLIDVLCIDNVGLYEFPEALSVENYFVCLFSLIVLCLSCLYVLIKVLNVYGFQETKGIKICSHNINRMENKMDEIEYNLLYSLNPPDIIGFCETFFHENISDDFINFPGYVSIRKDRTENAGGGWLIYINENISFERKYEIEQNDMETVWLEIKPSHRKSFLLCFVYRNPKSQTDWIDKFETQLNMAFSFSDDVTLLGDFNMNFLAPNKPPVKWLSLMETYNLNQIIDKPTRVTKDSQTLIDHIYTSDTDRYCESHVSHYSLSDHYPVCITRREQVCFKKVAHTTIIYRNFKKN